MVLRRAPRLVRGNATLCEDVEGEERGRQGKAHGDGMVHGLHIECRTNRVHTKVAKTRSSFALACPKFFSGIIIPRDFNYVSGRWSEILIEL